MDADWYREIILDRYKNPQYRGNMPNADIVLNGVNPACGDHLTFSLMFDGDVIKDMKFNGEGCAISVVAADMLIEKFIGKTLRVATNMTEHDVLELLGGEVGRARHKCALLAYHTIHDYANKTLS